MRADRDKDAGNEEYDIAKNRNVIVEAEAQLKVAVAQTGPHSHQNNHCEPGGYCQNSTEDLLLGYRELNVPVVTANIAQQARSATTP